MKSLHLQNEKADLNIIAEYMQYLNEVFACELNL